MRQSYTKLPAKTETHERFKAIMQAKDWSLTRTVEKAVEALAEREQITFPTQPTRSRRKPITGKRTTDTAAA